MLRYDKCHFYVVLSVIHYDESRFAEWFYAGVIMYSVVMLSVVVKLFIDILSVSAPFSHRVHSSQMLYQLCYHPVPH